jgi:signal peptidase II
LKKALPVVFLVLILDQALKIWVKTHMTLGQEIHAAGNWFIIHFTENEGMAFGYKLGGSSGKLFLSMFRIVAMILIAWYLLILSRKKASWGLIACISLIFAGALGNIIDSAFYGMLFSQSGYHEVAQFLPGGKGYAPFLHGKVVDMLYFPVIRGYYPDWFPWLGSREFLFFRPVFNIADSSITTGVLLLLAFQKKFYRK